MIFYLTSDDIYVCVFAYWLINSILKLVKYYLHTLLDTISKVSLSMDFFFCVCVCSILSQQDHSQHKFMSESYGAQ